jgi:hypothetical protein
MTITTLSSREFNQRISEAKKAAKSGIPQDVVEAHVLRDEPLIKAWREHLGLTQIELGIGILLVE